MGGSWMSTEKDEEKKTQSRRNFLKGAGAGVVVGAVAVAGIEEGIRLPAMQTIGGTSTVKSVSELGFLIRLYQYGTCTLLTKSEKP